MLTAVVVALLAVGLGCLAGFVAYRLLRERTYARGVRHGVALSEISHGWYVTDFPAPRPVWFRRRRLGAWLVLNRQDIVTRHFRPTTERAPLPPKR